MSEIITAPPIPAWLRGAMPSPDYQIRFKDSQGEAWWTSNKGAQTWVLLCPFDEILIGGRRGGSKSAALIAWFAMGDPSLPQGDPARDSFLNEPSFRGVIFREEYQGLAEFIDEAEDFYRPFGVNVTGGGSQPAVFDFKSGARLYTSHLGNREAFNKTKGWGLTKIGLEELTQIPEQEWYTKLFGSLRNKKQVRVYRGKQYPPLRTQILATTNPDGPGHVWVKNRFVNIIGANGQPVPPNTPVRDSITGLTRIFIPMRREDNPYLADNRKYEGMLLAQDEITRKQWMEGDWDAGSGTMFSEYRPHGPIGDEEQKYPWARHLIEPVHLQPWWFRFGGGDWGFQHNAVFYKACRNENDGRIHIYDELVQRQVGSFELGVLLAKWWLSDLDGLPDKQVTVHLSPDAFSKTDASKTKAEQMAMGIQDVLGPYGAFLLKYNDDERVAMQRDPKAAQMMFERRKNEMAQGQMCIVLKPANNDRIAGWSYIHELLRFRPIRLETEAEIKEDLKRVFELQGVTAYEKELKAYHERKPEILPRMVIWNRCVRADQFLQSAVHDDPPRAEDVRKFDAEDGVGGDDAGDGLRYTCMCFREMETKIPKHYWISERVDGIQREHEASYGETITDPTRLAMIYRTQNALFEKQNQSRGGSITLPRAGSMRHRLN